MSVTISTPGFAEFYAINLEAKSHYLSCNRIGKGKNQVHIK